MQPGERVLILSEYGRVEKDLPDLIGQAVKAAGGEYHVLWAEPIESPSQPAPPVLMAAMRAADKIIYNVPAGSPSDRLIAPVARYFDKDEGPPLVYFENDRVVRVEGGPEAEEYRKALEANEQRWGEQANYLDSWHSGLNPYAPNVAGFIGHGCSARMHFHAGRSDTYTSAGVIRHTFIVDGRTILAAGRLAFLNDPELRVGVGLDSG